MYIKVVPIAINEYIPNMFHIIAKPTNRTNGDTNNVEIDRKPESNSARSDETMFTNLPSDSSLIDDNET